ncbi:hypothetical protein G6O69_27825 [Pseudenhygromyxa sp. WMMC2535]|uniref:hypothetical protein n=1 Tax=Pseudenhygromyxa sp. WMMC2535 TaxID=2712867 RepID=UPI0015565BA5|nr:hypothetical protein [Pseudenhygromyxa sp. WMMC2535]NVB41679.1 hypothetical protein [Pseudenhygromyxa sp. WMMC2535]
MRRLHLPVALLTALAVSSSTSGLALAAVPPAPSQPAAEPAPAPAPTQNLSEDEKIELAKQKYMEAEGLAAQDRWVEAVVLYEEAYYLVPGKHGFAHKVGVAAFRAGDCDKANTYLKHFLTYGDADKHGDKIDEAKQILGEISVSGCASDSSGGTSLGGGGSTADPQDDEDPLGDSSRETRQKDAAQARKDKKDEKRGLLIGGAVLTAIGASGIILGVTGLGIANSSANTLQQLSSNSTNTGFPTGDYACRDVSSSECPFDLESRLRAGNGLGYAGFIIGGVGLAAGVALLAIYATKKKKSGGGMEENPDAGAGVAISGLGPMMLPGGGGGAAVELRF